MARPILHLYLDIDWVWPTRKSEIRVSSSSWSMNRGERNFFGLAVVVSVGRWRVKESGLAYLSSRHTIDHAISGHRQSRKKEEKIYFFFKKKKEARSWPPRWWWWSYVGRPALTTIARPFPSGLLRFHARLKSPCCCCCCYYYSQYDHWWLFLLDCSRLKTELQFLRKKGALKTAGQEQQQQQQVGVTTTSGAGLGGLDPHPADHGGHNNGRCCARCRTGLGRIINRGALCKSCRQRVCKACREYTAPKGSTNGTEWVCTVCYKTAWV